MKQQIAIVTCCVLLLALPSCQKRTASSSVSAGAFNVNSDTGMANGQAFGIEFRAAGCSSAEVKCDIQGNTQFSSRAEISLADDLKIELETMDDGNSVAFQLNGKKIGNLAKGDEVVIEEDRNVTVNGEDRTPE
jgi:hypothetical protein